MTDNRDHTAALSRNALIAIISAGIAPFLLCLTLLSPLTGLQYTALIVAWAIAGIALAYTTRQWLATHRQLESSRNRVHDLSVHDRVTGLVNRGVFENSLRREIERSVRYQQPLAVLLVDIVGFRALNIDRGTAVANFVLQQVADLCATTIRSSDLAARFGDDQIVLLLTQTDHSHLAEIANRLRAEVSNAQWVFDHRALQINVAVGGTHFEADGLHDTDGVLAQTLNSLGKAKQTPSGVKIEAIYGAPLLRDAS
ncbi:MAG: GGDEF domain-containing protein [Pseudomonadota bacterium]